MPGSQHTGTRRRVQRQRGAERFTDMRRKSRVQPRPSGCTNKQSCLAVTRLRVRVRANPIKRPQAAPNGPKRAFARSGRSANDNPPPFAIKKAPCQKARGFRINAWR